MAVNKKFITKHGLHTQNIDFVSPDETNTIQITMLDTDTLSFSGNSGQLFSITDSQTGTIFAVNDISGVSSIEVDYDGTIRLAETFGNVLIGTSTDDGTNKLQVNGNISLNGAISADGSIGTNGQVLTSDGTKTYWSTSVGFAGSAGDTGFTGSAGDTGFTGSKGETGNFGGATFDYTFDIDTSNTDPGVGNLKFNNSDLSLTTQMFIDDQDDNATDIQTFLRTIDDSTSTIKGHFRISNRLDASDFAIFTISSIQEETGYFRVDCSYVSGSATAFSDNEDIIITFARTGDRGDTGFTGSVGFTGSIGFTGSQGPEYEVLISETAPGGAASGDLWFNSNDASMYFYYTDVDTSQWVSISGPTGNTGYTGSAGSGFTGSAGNTGFTGSAGDVGFTGSQGEGFTGSQGDVGFTGSAGDVGFTGSAGDVGFTGSAGDTGFTGSAGDVGFTGSAGDTGFTGSAGDVGFTGSAGDTGFTGSAGDVGFTGSKGDDGTIAETSNTAPTPAVDGQLWFDTSDSTLNVYYDDGTSQQWITTSGPVGPQGDTGYTGSAGDTGDTGFTGSQGTDGTLAETSNTAPTPAVDGQLWFDTSDSTLNVYYDDGTSQQWITTSGPVGPQGDTGFTGSQGNDGTLAETSDTAPTPAVDGQLWFDTTDTTLNVYYDDGDSSQWVTVSGERGLTGYTGSVGFTGSIGYTGSQGDIGYTGSQGPEYEVLISETAPGGAASGDLWFNSNDASMYFYYNDGSSSQWVSTSGPTGATGYTGSAGEGVSTGKAIAMAIVFG